MNNQKKVDRYHDKFQKAALAVEEYLNEIGECLEESEYIADASEFRETLAAKLEARENARVQLERVVREEQIGVGNITVTKRSTVNYDGAFLYETLEPEIRDQLVEITYKVKSTEFKNMLANGKIPSDIADKAILSVKEGVMLKGVPTKVNLG